MKRNMKEKKCDIGHYDSQHNDSQHNDSQHNDIICACCVPLCRMLIVSQLSPIILSVIRLSREY